MLPGIELHHEALDGRGYPYGLKGEQIPLLARVIAVADTFDALTTNRPYQHAHTPEEALKIIQNLAGKRLDPEPVGALMAVYGRGEIRIQRIAIKDRWLRPMRPPASRPPRLFRRFLPRKLPTSKELASNRVSSSCLSSAGHNRVWPL